MPYEYIYILSITIAYYFHYTRLYTHNHILHMLKMPCAWMLDVCYIYMFMKKQHYYDI